jgi:hypothetical protein
VPVSSIFGLGGVEKGGERLVFGRGALPLFRLLVEELSSLFVTISGRFGVRTLEIQMLKMREGIEK